MGNVWQSELVANAPTTLESSVLHHAHVYFCNYRTTHTFLILTSVDKKLVSVVRHPSNNNGLIEVVAKVSNERLHALGEYIVIRPHPNVPKGEAKFSVS